MKTTYRLMQVFVCLLFGLVWTSCNDDMRELDKGSTPLELNVNRSSIVLEQKNDYAEAVVFQWTTGTNYGTGASIEYTFQIDRAGSNFANPVSMDMGKGVYELKNTTKELNDLILNQLNGTPGTIINLEARIIAKINDASIESPDVASCTLQATPYKGVSSTLYLIGDASPNGWNADNATEMNPVSGEPGGFIWTGNLTAGELKFITSLGNFLPSYNKGATDLQLVYRDSDDQPDDKFRIESASGYKIKLNLLSLTIEITPSVGPKYDMIYFVGSFTGWSFEPMMQDKANPFVFRLGREMTWNDGGEFKFGTAAGSWDNMYHPTIANAPFTHTEVTQDGTDDRKWLMSESEANKAYKMALDITEGAESFNMYLFTPFPMIYLVGEATPNGWDVDNAIPMNPVDGDPHTFIWTGNLKTGEMKFSCDKQGDWGGAWFLAYENGLMPDGQEQQMVFSANGDGGNDRKWNITSAGNYTIILNQLQEIVSIIKNF